MAFLFSEKECLVVGKDENIVSRVVEYVVLLCGSALEKVPLLAGPLFFGVYNRRNIFFFAKNGVLFFLKKKYESTPRRKAFFIERYAFMRRETTTTTREDTRTHQRNRRKKRTTWRIFAFLYLFVLCGCCTTSAVLFTLFLFVFFAPSYFLHFCLVLFALVAPPVVLKTDFFREKNMAKKGRAARILNTLHKVNGTKQSEALKRRERKRPSKEFGNTETNTTLTTNGKLSEWKKKKAKTERYERGERTAQRSNARVSIRRRRF